MIAEFTQEGGYKFAGDISINAYGYDKDRESHGYIETDWQNVKEGNKIRYDTTIGKTIVEIGIVPLARITMIDTSARGSERLGATIKGDEVKVPIPSGDKLFTVEMTFDVEVKPFETTVTGAADVEAAVKAPLAIYEYRYGVFNDWKTEKIGNQFRFTGKYYTGYILKR